ncbi:U3 small nucleolar RNA-associated protein 6-domain-containing protein [Myxozyma melibiosi]|uniref:U3 small nucleolar RNA-associated protein 6-domain-containing protein n=1 Tax=Myxozyma melibiosi TaxID=54550 RepID=A0ABR1F0Q9_9ASCO
MSAKVRYYLEQTLPELEELHKHNIFSRPELTTITRRRTDFEHRINNRGVTLLDFLKYVEFEMNLDLLRKRRIQRVLGSTKKNKDGDEDEEDADGLLMKKVGVAGWSGQQRVLFVFDRATKRFPGDISLWTQYASYARQIKARKVLNKIFKSLVKLHPMNPQIWVMAADHELRDNANRLAARNVLLKGIQFNKDAKVIADAYEKLEADVQAALEAELKAKESQQEEEESDEEDDDHNDEEQEDDEEEEDDDDDDDESN